MDKDTTSPRPWRIDIQSEGDWEHGYHYYVTGVLDANGDWVIRFDDDYGTDQRANAALIIAAVNEYDRRNLSRPVSS